MSSENAAGYAGDVLAAEAYRLLSSHEAFGPDRCPDRGGMGLRRRSRSLGPRQDSTFSRMAEFSDHAGRPGLCGAPDALARSRRRRTRRAPAFPLPVRRPLATGGGRDDQGGLGSMPQRLGRIRGPVWIPGATAMAWAAGRRAAFPGSRPSPHSLLRETSASQMIPSLSRARVPTMGLRHETVAVSSEVNAVGGPLLGQSWRRCSERLRAELGDDIFNSWFGRIELEFVAGGQARLSVPTRFLKSWIDTHYQGPITAALAAEFGALARILVVVRSSVRPDSQPSVHDLPDAGRAQARVARPEPNGALDRADAAPSSPSVSADALVGSPLDRRLTFSTFQVGRSNQLAFTAAKRLAESLGGPGLVVLPAVHPLGGRPRQDPPFAGGGAHRRRAGPLGDLSDGRKVHVRLRRRPSGADLDRLQGAPEGDRSPDFRRCAVPAGEDHPGGIRTCAERAARRRAAR